MLLEYARAFLGDEWRNPNRRLEPSLADAPQHGPHVTTERLACLEPVAHRRLIAIVDLYVAQRRHPAGDELQILHHLVGRDFRTKAVPRAPALRRLRSEDRAVIRA